MIKYFIFIVLLIAPRFCLSQGLTFKFIDNPVSPGSGLISEIDNSSGKLRVSGIVNPNTSRYVHFISDEISLSGLKTIIYEADINLVTGLRSGNSQDPCGDCVDGCNNSMGTPVLFRISLNWSSLVEISMQSIFGFMLEQAVNLKQLPDEISMNGGIAKSYWISYWTEGKAAFDPFGFTSQASMGAKYHAKLSVDFESNKVMAEIKPVIGYENRFNPLPPGSNGAIASPYVVVANLIDYTKDPNHNGKIFCSIHIRTNGNTDVDSLSAPGGTLRYIDREFTNIKVRMNEPVNFPRIPQMTSLFLPDNFDKGILEPFWTRYIVKGLNFTAENKILKLSGNAGETGYSSFISSNAGRQNVTVEIDFKAPTGIQSDGSFRLEFDQFNYFTISISKEGYRLVRVADNQIDAYGEVTPLSGNEVYNFHHLKLVYDDLSGHIDAFVDNIKLGGIVNKLFPASLTSINFAFYAHTVQGQLVEYDWDNFNSTYKDQKIFRVTNTGSAGTGSLRQAINDVNSSVGADSVIFNIPKTDSGYDAANGTFIIATDYVMPALDDSSTVIDGSTQNIYLGEKLNPGKPMIVLDGKNVKYDSWGLKISSGNNKISNLQLKNYIKGIVIENPDAKRNSIDHNIIGSIPSGIFSPGNKWGIYISGGANNNQIGPENIVAYNDSDGIRITGSSSTCNTLIRNSITQNGGLGIFNEAGGNSELNPPNILSIINGLLNGTAEPNSHVEIFSDSGNEGKDFLGSIKSGNDGKYVFDLTKNIPNRYITATSTDINGNTSKFSEPFDYALTAKEGTLFPACGITSYPNPINHKTIIRYQIPENSEITVEIHNLSGIKIRTLVKKKQNAGIYTIYWDMRDVKGTIVNNGTYLCVLRTGFYLTACKLIVIR